MSFNPVNPQVNFPELEEQKLKFWEEEKIFEESIKNRKGKERFVFYEGPPTANGKPHMGHALQRSLKDLVLRYKTMKGYLVERRAGWDTHGLPVELEIEKELGLRGKQDILSLKENEFESIKFFNQKCRESVFKYVDIWVELTRRIGFWIDFDNAYVTYDDNYIESGWWFLNEAHKKGLLYKDYKVVPYCPRCGTSLSSHELAQGYKDDIEDPSVYIKFELVDEPGTYVLVWTTTPWTLPGNVALAIGKKIEYVKVKQGADKYILAKSRLGILEGDYEVLGLVKVEELLNKSYKPLYPYLANIIEKKEANKGYFIAEADFASDIEGTGVVHTAVMYGVEDFNLGKKLNLPMEHTVNTKGQFISEVTPFAGKFVKSADKDIIEDLKRAQKLYKAETIKHTYPFCWRCGTPVLYYALDAWFLKTTAVKNELLENNQKINWVPKTIKTGRMKNWLETLIDWNVSRNRFWGTPMPVWLCKNNHIKVVGSKAELEELGGRKIEDLHRPFIDQISFSCPDCGEVMKREPYVLDVWFDSGAMPYAQWHYPFENKETFEEWYPADYIVEGIDQTRGWYYTLMAEAMVLGKSAPAPFKNVVTTGFILDDQGRKMSKSKGNVISPMDVMPLAGADAIRWYLFTNASAGGDVMFSKDLLLEAHRKFTLILWNCYKFFMDYAALHNWDCRLKRGELNVLDKWILARLTEVVLSVNSDLDKYSYTSASKAIEEFVVEDFSTWYIRRSRGRVAAESLEDDKNTALSVMYGCLVTLSKLLAPFMPFLAEELFVNLADERSVHLADYPLGDKSLLNEKLVADMKTVRRIVEIGHAKRKEANIKLRQPLPKITYSYSLELDKNLEEIIKDELNIKEVHYQAGGDDINVSLDSTITPELKAEGEARDLIRQVQQMRKDHALTLKDKITIHAPAWPKSFEAMILKTTAAQDIIPSDKLSIEKISA